jgi:hypothetical protein
MVHNKGRAIPHGRTVASQPECGDGYQEPVSSGPPGMPPLQQVPSRRLLDSSVSRHRDGDEKQAVGAATLSPLDRPHKRPKTLSPRGSCPDSPIAPQNSSILIPDGMPHGAGYNGVRPSHRSIGTVVDSQNREKTSSNATRSVACVLPHPASSAPTPSGTDGKPSFGPTSPNCAKTNTRAGLEKPAQGKRISSSIKPLLPGGKSRASRIRAQAVNTHISSAP